MECNLEAVRSTEHSMTLSVDPRSRHSVFGISVRTSVSCAPAPSLRRSARRCAIGLRDALQCWHWYSIPCRRLAAVGIGAHRSSGHRDESRAGACMTHATSPRRDQ